MKAIIWTNYGPPEVLQLQEVDKPTPKDNEVLIRIHATSVTKGDCEMRCLKLPLYISLPLRIWFGFNRPKRMTIPGTEIAGEIEAAGKDVKRFKVGDQVFGSTGFQFGTYAEYKCLPEDGALAIKPARITFEEAAAVAVGGLEALHFIKQANIQRGQKVLIVGAGGSIGTFGVQLARHYGAEVTGVDSAAKLEMLRSIGAARVIDYTQEDFTRNAETYDVIFDVVGESSFSRSLKSLSKTGYYLLANPSPSDMFRARWVSMTGSQKVLFGPSSYPLEDLNFLRRLLEAGEIKTVIDRSYPLEQAAAAHRYVDSGQKKGNVVITVLQDHQTS